MPQTTQHSGVTFAVDDVTPATKCLPEWRTHEAAKLNLGSIESCSDYHGTALKDVHYQPLLAAVYTAFNHHHQPRLRRPDGIGNKGADMARKKEPKTGKARTAGTGKTVRVYTLTVSLLGEPGTTTVSARTLELRGDQTLAVLHEAICDAFGYENGPVYQFQRGEGPADLDGPRYVTPDAFDIAAEDGQPAAGRVDQTVLAALGLEVGQRFSYWIDCGDDWWHALVVDKIADKLPRGKYPKVLRRTGPNPLRQPDGGTNGIMGGTREVADAACLVGELHLSKREYPKAIEAFTRAIEENPTPDAYQGRAKAYRALAAADDRASRRARG